MFWLRFLFLFFFDIECLCLQLVKQISLKFLPNTGFAYFKIFLNLFSGWVQTWGNFWANDLKYVSVRYIVILANRFWFIGIFGCRLRWYSFQSLFFHDRLKCRQSFFELLYSLVEYSLIEFLDLLICCKHILANSKYCVKLNFFSWFSEISPFVFVISNRSVNWITRTIIFCSKFFFTFFLL